MIPERVRPDLEVSELTSPDSFGHPFHWLVRLQSGHPETGPVVYVSNGPPNKLRYNIASRKYEVKCRTVGSTLESHGLNRKNGPEETVRLDEFDKTLSTFGRPRSLIVGEPRWTSTIPYSSV